jgi:hypothetical protein
MLARHQGIACRFLPKLFTVKTMLQAKVAAEFRLRIPSSLIKRETRQNAPFTPGRCSRMTVETL